MAFYTNGKNALTSKILKTQFNRKDEARSKKIQSLLLYTFEISIHFKAGTI